MKFTKFYSAILAILGIPFSSCENVNDDAYGSPYSEFHLSGSVKDAEGTAVDEAEISLYYHMESNDEACESYDHKIGKTKTNADGKYSIVSCGHTGGCMVIAKKDGYKPDTVKFEVKSSDYVGGDGEWFEGSVIKSVDLNLQKDGSENKD